MSAQIAALCEMSFIGTEFCMPLCSKRWQIAPPAPPSHVARFPHLHPITVQVLYNRGVTNPAGVAVFLRGESGEDGEVNPFALKGMNTAVTRLRQALRAGEFIAVYGDFDADGVTATALLVQTLRALGGHVSPYIPHRVDEGYGLHKAALTQLARNGVHVVVTVDCGPRPWPWLTPNEPTVATPSTNWPG
jgi:single-stranded-DNA-specific exonuclease